MGPGFPFLLFPLRISVLVINGLKKISSAISHTYSQVVPLQH